MITGDFIVYKEEIAEPTCMLRWGKDGKLQQKWIIQTINTTADDRNYINPTQSRVEWRPVKQEDAND